MDFEFDLPIVAAPVGGHGRADWGFWANSQLRDQNGEDAGEWIEMGRSSRFRYSKPDGSISTGSAIYLGPSRTPNHGRFYVKGVDGVKDGVYDLDAGSIDPVKFYFAEGTKLGDYLENYYKSIGRDISELDVSSKLPVIDFSTLTPTQPTKEDLERIKPENRVPPPRNIKDEVAKRTETAKTARQLQVGDIVHDNSELNRYGSVEFIDRPDGEDGPVEATIRWENNQIEQLKLDSNQELATWPEGPVVDEKKSKKTTKKSGDLVPGDRIVVNGEIFEVIDFVDRGVRSLTKAKSETDGREELFPFEDSQKIEIAPEKTTAEPVAETPAETPVKTTEPAEAKQKKASQLKKGDRILIDGEPHLVSEVAKEDEAVVLQVSPEDGQGSFEQEFEVDEVVDLAPKKLSTEGKPKAEKEEEPPVSASKATYDNVLKNGGATFIFDLKPGDVLLAANGQEFLFISGKRLGSKDGKQPYEITVQSADGVVQTFTTADNRVKTKQEPLPKKSDKFEEFDLRQLKVVNKKSQLKTKVQAPTTTTEEKEEEEPVIEGEATEKEIGELRKADTITVGGESAYSFKDYVFIDGKGYGVIDIIEEDDGSGVKLKLQTIPEDINEEPKEFILDKLYQYDDIINLATESGKPVKSKKSVKPKKETAARVEKEITGAPRETGTLLSAKRTVETPDGETKQVFSGVTYKVSNSGKRVFLRGIDKSNKAQKEKELRFSRVKKIVDNNLDIFDFFYNRDDKFITDGAPTYTDSSGVEKPVGSWVLQIKYTALLATPEEQIKKILDEIKEALAVPEPTQETQTTEEKKKEGISGEINTTGRLARGFNYTVNNDGTISLVGIPDLEDGYDELFSFIKTIFPNGEVSLDVDDQIISVYSSDENSSDDLRSKVLTEIFNLLNPEAKIEKEEKEEAEPETTDSTQRYYDIYEAAQIFFAEQLQSSPEAIKYLESRGIDLQTAIDMGIGFSSTLKTKYALFEKLMSLGFTKEEIVNAGLAKRDTSQPDRPATEDYFKDSRLLFPFKNSDGKVIGYTGRSISTDPKQVKKYGKYKVTENNDVYGKAKTLYNLSDSVESVKQTGQLIIVEGQFDAVAMVEAGRKNVIATSTASISKEQIDLLKEVFGDDLKEIVIVYDSDIAGQKGKENVGAVLKQAGYEVYEASVKQPADTEKPMDVAELYQTGKKEAIDDLIVSKKKFGGPSDEQLAEITSLLIENADIFSQEDVNNYLSILDQYSKENADVLISKLKDKIKEIKDAKEIADPMAQLEEILKQAKEQEILTEVQVLKILDKIKRSSNKKEDIQKKIDELKPKLKQESIISDKQRASINRRFSMTIVTQEQRDAMVAILENPSLTQEDIGRVIKTLDYLEATWRMDNGWTLPETDRGYSVYFEPVIGIQYDPEKFTERLRSYKPTKDVNGKPLEVEKPEEAQQKGPEAEGPQAEKPQAEEPETEKPQGEEKVEEEKPAAEPVVEEEKPAAEPVTTTPATPATPATTPINLGNRTGTRVIRQTMDNNAADGSRVYAPGGAFRGEKLRQNISRAYQKGGWPAVLEYLKSANLVAIDTETTGMEEYDGQLVPGNRLIQIGASRRNKNGEVEYFNIYVNPETGVVMSDWSKGNLKRPVLDENGKPTGEYVLIEKDWLDQQADEKEALQKFIDFVGGDAILLAHNLNFDISVIAEALERHGLSIDAMGAIDTMDLVGFMLPTYNPTGKTSTGKSVPVELDGPKRVANGIKPSEADPNNPEHFQQSRTLKDSLEYFGLSTSGHHRADADAFDALRVLESVLDWVIKNPEKESTNAIGQRVLDFSKIDQSNDRSYANYMKVLGSNNPATPRQKDPSAKIGFANDLRKFGISEKEISDIMQPIASMTRGQAAEYIASILGDLRAGDKPDLDRALQRSKVSGAATRPSNVIPSASVDQELKVEEISKKAQELSVGDRVRLDGEELYGTVKSVEKTTAGFINLTIVYDDGTEEEIQIRPNARIAVYRTVDPKDAEAFEPTEETQSEPAAEPADEPAAEPVTEPAAEPVTEPTTEAEAKTEEKEEPKVKTVDLSDYKPEDRDVMKQFFETLNRRRELEGKPLIPVIESGRPEGLVDRKEPEYIDKFATKEDMYDVITFFGVPKWKAKIMAAKLHAAKGTPKYKKELKKVNDYLDRLDQKNRNFGRLEEKVTFFEFLRRNGIRDEIGFVLSGETPEAIANRKAARDLYWAWRDSVEKRSRTTKTIKDGGISITYSADEEGHAQRLLQEAKKAMGSRPLGDNRKLEIKILDPDQLVLLGLGNINGASLVNDDVVQIAISSATIGKKDKEQNIRKDTYTLLHEYGHIYEETTLTGEDRIEFAKDITGGKVEEIFADLYAQVEYAKLTKTKLKEQVAIDFKELLKKFDARRKQDRAELKKSGPFFSESGARPNDPTSFAAKAHAAGGDVLGIVERTGKDLEKFEARTTGFSRTWLAGSDEESGYIPDLSDDEVAAEYAEYPTGYTPDQIKELSAEDRARVLKDTRDFYEPIIKEQKKDTRKYRVFSIPETNIHIRFKEGSVNFDTLQSVVRELKDLNEFNDMGGMPVIVTLADPNKFTIANNFLRARSDDDVFEGFNTLSADRTQMHVVLNLATANKKYIPDSRDNFKETLAETTIINSLIHEYLGHGIAKIFLGQHKNGQDNHGQKFKDFESKFPLTEEHPVSYYGNESTGESFAEYIRAAYLLTKFGMAPTNDKIREFVNYIDPILQKEEPLLKTNEAGESLAITDMKESKPQRFARSNKLSSALSATSVFVKREAYYANGLDPYGRPAEPEFRQDLKKMYNRVAEARDEYHGRIRPVSGSLPVLWDRYVNLSRTINELYDSKYFNYAKANPKDTVESILQRISTADSPSSIRKWQASKPFVPLRYPSKSEKFNNDLVVSTYTDKNGDAYQVAYVSSAPASAKEGSADQNSESAHVFVSAPNQPLAEFIDFETTFNELIKKSTGHMRIENPGITEEFRAEFDLDIQSTYVKPKYRRKGLATAMLAVAKQNSRKNLKFSEEQTIQEDSWARSVDQKAENHLGMPAFVDEYGDLRPAEVSPAAARSVFGYQNKYEKLPEQPKINYNKRVRDNELEEDTQAMGEQYLASALFNGLEKYTSSTGGGIGINASVVGAVRTDALSSMAGNEVDEARVLEIMEKIKSGEGFHDPVIVYYNPDTKDMVVADGNHHVEAAKRLKIPYVPTRVISGKFNPEEYLSVKKSEKVFKENPFVGTKPITGSPDYGYWPLHVNPYFVFKLDDLYSSFSGDGKPIVDKLSRELIVKTGKGVKVADDPIVKLMGRFVRDSQTGEIYQVIDEYYENNQPTGEAVVRKLIGQADGLQLERRTIKTGDQYDLSNGKKAFIVIGNESFNEEYNDKRQYVQETRNTADLEDVTESFVEAGGQGRISTESMFFQWTEDDSVKGRINRYVSPGEVELISLAGTDEFGEKQYEKRIVPIKQLLIIPNQRETLGDKPAEHSTDMLADATLLGPLSIVVNKLINKGLISLEFGEALRRTFTSKSQTRSGAEDMLQSLQSLDRRGGVLVKKARDEAIAKQKAEAKQKVTAQPAPQGQPKPPVRKGRMTFQQLYERAVENKKKSVDSRPIVDQMNRTPENVPLNNNPINPPDSNDVAEIIDILAELRETPELGLTDDEIKVLVDSLGVASRASIEEYLSKLLYNRLEKRMNRGEKIAGIRIPEDLNEDQLKAIEMYSKKVESGVGLPKREVEISLSKEQAETVALALGVKRGSVLKIGGEAGTGKSVTLKALVKELVKGNKNYAVVTPTAVAAQNLPEAKARTIHSVFGINPFTFIADGFNVPFTEKDENGIERTIQISSEVDFLNAFIKTAKAKQLAKLEYLIIDEVSMVDAYLMDLMDIALQTAKNNFDDPFGGVKLIAFGDDYQLPPVAKMSQQKYNNELEPYAKQLENGGAAAEAAYLAKKRSLDAERRKGEYMESNYASPRWFNANVFSRTPITLTELTEIQRQKGDKEFAELLTRARSANQTAEDIAKINTQKLPSNYNYEGDTLFITYLNDEADKINSQQINKLINSGAEKTTFTGTFEGNRGAFGEKELPIAETVTYYIGEMVMFDVNDNADLRDQVGIEGGDRRFENGTVGTIVEFSERGFPIVEVERPVFDPVQNKFVQEKFKVEVAPNTYTATTGKNTVKIDENTGKPVVSLDQTIDGTYKQIPLVPGYATTVRKSQGKTLDKGVLALGTDKKPNKSWEPGQIYVALSRFRTLEGISLTRNILPEDFIVDPEIIEFYKEVERVSATEKQKENERKEKLEEEKTTRGTQQPSKPIVDAKKSIPDRPKNPLEFLFKDKLNQAELDKAAAIIERKTKAVPDILSNWGTADLAPALMNDFGYLDEDEYSKDIEAITTKNIKNLNMEQRLLASLILKHGAADIYIDSESGSVIKRFIEDDPTKAISDKSVIYVTDAHKFISNTGHVINNGYMDIELRYENSEKTSTSILGEFSPTSDKIQIFAGPHEDDFTKTRRGSRGLVKSKNIFYASTLAHEYGHYLDAEVGNWYKNRPEVEPTFSSYIADLIKSGMKNRAKQVLDEYALQTYGEYTAESYAGYIMQGLYGLDSDTQNQTKVFDPTLIEKLLLAINEKNNRKSTDTPSPEFLKAREKALDVKKELEKENKKLWERLKSGETIDIRKMRSEGR